VIGRGAWVRKYQDVREEIQELVCKSDGSLDDLAIPGVVEDSAMMTPAREEVGSERCTTLSKLGRGHNPG
jgi:hypothetical protein